VAAIDRRRILMCNIMSIGACVLFLGTWALAKDHRQPLSGTWQCQAHGGSQGDMDFTLYLQQSKETVDGNISSPLGGTELSSGTFHHNQLEIHIDTPQGNYILLAKLHKGTLDGTWSSDSEKGTWTGKRKAEQSK